MIKSHLLSALSKWAAKKPPKLQPQTANLWSNYDHEEHDEENDGNDYDPDDSDDDDDDDGDDGGRD